MKRYKKLRKQTKQLLEQGEGSAIDYKRNGFIDPEDLVAFANSEQGGHILLGVQETKDKNGRMIGKPVGLVLDDELARNIQGKANSCVPPVKIIVAEENADSKKPIVRVDVPSSKKKPHCTGAGTYKIRSLAGNKPLLPNEILELLLNTESNRFLQRFAASTENLLNSVNNLQSQIVSPISELSEQINQVMAHTLSEIETTQDKLSNRLQQFSDTSDQADAVLQKKDTP